jgi:GTP-binding protein Era
VALVGRPNVGKSTLLNKILGQKISITSHRPQTTRHRILGIRTTDSAQAIYVDTPGLNAFTGRAVNRYMNRTASVVLEDVDLVIMVVEGTRWTEGDQLVLARVRQAGCPVILVINKIDRLRDKTTLLPHLELLAGKGTFAQIVPVSARNGENLPRLEHIVETMLPAGQPCFPEDQVTDRSERFLAAELVREKLFRRLGKEVPYGLTVEIERFQEEGELLRIYALIVVERPGQKTIVIGRHGQQLKEVGSQAREEMERLFGRKVYLQLWVKVKTGWTDDERVLRSLGYDEGN